MDGVLNHLTKWRMLLFQPELTACTSRNLHGMHANSTVNNRACKHTSFTRLAMAEYNGYCMLSANACCQGQREKFVYLLSFDKKTSEPNKVSLQSALRILSLLVFHK